MKQITFSNVLAVVAILLCFYAFAEEKSSSSNLEEKEYCTLTVTSSGVGHKLSLIFPDGKTEYTDLKNYAKETNGNDYFNLNPTTQKLNELGTLGWELKGQSSLMIKILYMS